MTPITAEAAVGLTLSLTMETAMGMTLKMAVRTCIVWSLNTSASPKHSLQGTSAQRGADPSVGLVTLSK